MLPHSYEAEQAVLACYLIDEDIREHIPKTQEEDFYIEINREIFKAIQGLYSKNKDINIITLNNIVNNISYISTLQDILFGTYNFIQFFEILKEKSRLRSLYRLSESITQSIIKENDSNEIKNNIINTVEAFDITLTSEVTDIKLLANTFLQDAHENKAIETFKTGYADYDRLTEGFHKQELTIIAARPGIGKTAFAHLAAIRIARTAPVLFVSREMSKAQNMNRMFSQIALVDSFKIRNRQLNEKELESLTRANETFQTLQIDITTEINYVQEIKAYARKMRGKGVIFIDYLQLLNTSKKCTSREQEIADISRNLKCIALDYNIPVIALSQLNRAVETRATKEPCLADLRESGAIEQDADNIIFIHKSSEEEQTPTTQWIDCKVIIAKQRNGSTGKINMRFRPPFCRFETLLR